MQKNVQETLFEGSSYKTPKVKAVFGQYVLYLSLFKNKKK